MIDWLTFVIALVIIASLVGFFGFLAWKINESNSLSLGKSDEHSHHHSLTDSTTEKKKGHEQNKKKRKEQKKPKRDAKDEETKQRNPSKEPSTQTSEETEDESGQDSSSAQAATTDLSSKARKRNKNKSAASTEKNSNATARVPPATHPKSGTQKEEVGTEKQSATKAQGKAAPHVTKPAPTATTTKKTSAPAVPQEQALDEEQPFTVVGGNRNKNSSSAQPTKTQVVNTPTPPVASQPEPLAPRQQAPPKETTITATSTGPVSGATTVAPTRKPSPVSMKLADLVRGLPSSQVVVTELMSALDASALSSDELDLIMHKIANKQSVLKQDWSKLQYGKKVDPQEHIGQAMDESSKNYQEDLKNNSVKRIKELTDELHNEKRRVSDLLKDKTDKEREIQILHAQLDSIQPKQLSSQQQTLQAQLQRLTEENVQLRQQRQQVDTAGATGEAGQVQQRVMQEQICKLSVQNADWEKKVKRVEALLEETQKQKDQLTHSLDKLQREWKQNEEKHHQSQNAHQHEVRELQVRLEQLEKDNEQLRREEIVHVEPSTTTDVQTITLTNEEREQLENEIEKLKGEQQTLHEQQRQLEQTKQQIRAELEEAKKKLHELQNQVQTVENAWKQEKQSWNESRDQELREKNIQLDEWKTKHETALHQAAEQRRHLVELLPQDLRQKVSPDNQGVEQWLSSYRNVFHSHLDSTKRHWEEQAATLKKENEQLHQNMQDIGKQLKDIEQTVQSKEESLIHELKNKDEKLGSFVNENERLTGELHRLRSELERVQSAYETSLSEIRALKVQLDERFLVAANTPPVVTDDSFELIKQSPSSLSPIVIDIRAEQLNELIRSSKEALENQDSLTEQLDRHLDDMNRGAVTG